LEVGGEPVGRPYLKLIVGIVLLTGLLLRLKGLSDPPFDSHTSRQTHTLSTIEAFHSDGIDLLHPRVIYTGYPGVLVLELPVFQALGATLYNIFGAHIELIRILNILFGTATMWLLYKVARHLFDATTAVAAAMIYWLAPVNILYQRSVLLDPSAVFLSTLSFYCLALLLIPGNMDAAANRSRQRWIWFGIFGGATLIVALVKALYLWPTVLLLGWVLLSRRFKWGMWTVLALLVFGLAGIGVLVWNHHATVVNDASPGTRGANLTGFLGAAALFSRSFYLDQLFVRPIWWLGLVGMLLFPVGLAAT
jgi:4-amino-4-deoxy-L-arabinose transferase-like glycosyltransferase